MKKSKQIVLVTVFASAVAACGHPYNQWISGEENGICRDTLINTIPHRFYRGAWYPIYNDQINLALYASGYHGGSFSSFHSASIHTHGFGRSAHCSSVGA